MSIIYTHVPGCGVAGMAVAMASNVWLAILWQWRSAIM